MQTGTIIYKGMIKGKFMGFKNSYTKFEFTDGQVWKQSENKFLQHYAYNPEVQIIYKDEKYYLEVRGLDEMVEVRRLK
jgi:hypothetical protein